MTPNIANPLGLGLLMAYCTAILPIPDSDGGPPILTAVTIVQPTLGLGTDPRTGAALPDVASGRQLLTGAIITRISTQNGTLPDTVIPTTVGNYGVDLADSAFADMTTTEFGMLAADVDAQVRQEQRIVTSTTSTTAANSFLLVSLQLADGTGPFSLTLAIDVLAGNLSVLSSPT